jgi:hypothetical protein
MSHRPIPRAHPNYKRGYPRPPTPFWLIGAILLLGFGVLCFNSARLCQRGGTGALLCVHEGRARSNLRGSLNG